MKVRETLTSLASFEAGLRALLLLNLLDAFATLTWVLNGLAHEANPVMAQAIDLGPAAFVLSKVALVTLAAGLLWRNRSSLTARVALVPVVLLYAFVGGGHIGFAINQGVVAAASLLLPIG